MNVNVQKPKQAPASAGCCTRPVRPIKPIKPIKR
jgi:hypothetical protein